MKAKHLSLLLSLPIALLEATAMRLPETVIAFCKSVELAPKSELYKANCIKSSKC